MGKAAKSEGSILYLQVFTINIASSGLFGSSPLTSLPLGNDQRKIGDLPPSLTNFLLTEHPFENAENFLDGHKRINCRIDRHITTL